MSQNGIGDQLGQAWAYHRAGQQDEAAQAFQQILNTNANHIDALFGLGLAQRGSQQPDAALETFQRCLTLVNQALEAEPGSDRYEILQRMLEQRIAEIKSAAPGS
ncbi:MAG: tetratricopeptide repeat protein [Chloroflexi bacterium]|nr:tetratricopeptide repeat protein [Chloroflexota bacterium]